MTTLLEARPGVSATKQGGQTVLHAHYYDAALHRAITETGKLDGRSTLERAAASAAYRSLSSHRAVKRPAEVIGRLIHSCGLGHLALVDGTSSRFEFSLERSPYALARLEMFGPVRTPACDSTRGILSGGLSALTGRAMEVVETECIAAGGNRCYFVATPASAPGLEIEIAPFDWPARASVAQPEQVIGGGLVASLISEDGTPVGATYGTLWAELYARAAYDFEREVPRVLGAKFANLASVVLTEAAHLGTFYSIGGLFRTEEWRSLADGYTSREEWLHAAVELINGFGWGTWRIDLLSPEQRLTVHIADGNEALSHLSLAGEATTPRCHFARGVVAALMNLVYLGEIRSPEVLNQSLYNALFRSPSSFRAIETRCQAMGHPHCEFVANPLSPGLGGRR
jgi:hypothetical protein